MLMRVFSLPPDLRSVPVAVLWKTGTEFVLMPKSASDWMSKQAVVDDRGVVVDEDHTAAVHDGIAVDG